mmetsp:Transcript_9218/g.23834  ORF Transcript_9218/g.23834 Transcript_9218/m.23834 type:complete len:262 (-) Transcript_9218:896-1681(-)
MCLATTDYLNFPSTSLERRVRADLLDLSDHLLRIGVDRVPVLGEDLVEREERCHEANAKRAVAEEVTRVVEVDARRGVEREHGQSCAHRLDPHVRTRDAREDLLDRRPGLVRSERLRRRLAARDDHDVARRAPGNNLGHEHGGDDELGAGIESRLGIGHRQHCAAANHHLGAMLGAEVTHRVEHTRGGERELRDLETAGNSGLHRLGCCLLRGRAQHGARAVRRKPAQDSSIVLRRLGVRVGRETRVGSERAARSRGCDGR